MSHQANEPNLQCVKMHNVLLLVQLHQEIIDLIKLQAYNSTYMACPVAPS